MFAQTQIRRREMLQTAGRTSAGLLLASSVGTLGFSTAPQKRPKVAAVITEFTFRSHAHVILENFLEPYYFNGQLTDPGVDVVSFYIDQFPGDRDMARAVSNQYGIKIYPTIAGALCRGGSTLAVDGVLSIAEHGNYPLNEKGQRQYPRKRFFDEIIAVMKGSGRSVPLFNDKHLSYRTDWSQEMYDTTQQLKIPFMAGSSVPLAQRRPPLDLPDGVEIEEAISVHGGPLEAYDFHSMELLQSFIESRKGGETGVSKIQFLEGEDVWKAADQGLWSTDLAEACLAAELGPQRPPLRKFIEPGRKDVIPSHAILLTYRDGLRAVILRVGSSDFRWDFGCRLKGERKPRATSLYVGPWRNRNLFKALSHAIQSHMIHGRAPYPVERTLLVTGMLDAAMQSRFQQGAALATPQLNTAYAAIDFRAMREMGATWKIITEEMPEPKGIDPGGPRN